MIDECRWIEKDSEGSGRGLIEIPSMNLPEEYDGNPH
jgi:hypothetical protein